MVSFLIVDFVEVWCEGRTDFQWFSSPLLLPPQPEHAEGLPRVHKRQSNVCFRCGQPGHTVMFCPLPEGESLVVPQPSCKDRFLLGGFSVFCSLDFDFCVIWLR